MTAVARVTALTLLLLIIAIPAHAAEMTMSLDNVAVNTCDTSWTEGSCELMVVDTIVEDFLPGFCSWLPLAEEVALMGARLVIDVSALDGVDWIEVDVTEFSGDGHTRLFAYEEGSNVLVNFVMSFYDGSETFQTLMMDVAGSKLGTIAVSAQGARVSEVRLSGFDLVSTEYSSWTAMKSRW